MKRKEYRIGYKVVQLTAAGTRSSLYVQCTGRVPYHPGQTARPMPGAGPLAVFMRQADAVRFAGGMCDRAEVWRVRYVRSEWEALWVPGMAARIPPESCPFGTDFADEVTPLRQVR